MNDLLFFAGEVHGLGRRVDDVATITGQFLDNISAFFQPGCRKGAIGRSAERADHGAARTAGVAGEILDLEYCSLNGLIGVLPVIFPDADSGQGLVAEMEGVPLTSGDKRLLGVGVCFGEALQRFQFLHTEPAVPQAQLTHLRPIQLNAAIHVRVERPQVVELTRGGVVAGVPHTEGHVSQRFKCDRVSLDDLDNRPLVVFEIGRVVTVRIEGDKLAGGVLQPGRGHRFFRNFINAG